MAVHEDGRHLVRAVESVLNQRDVDVQLVLSLVSPASRLGTYADRLVERELRVEVVRVPGATEGQALEAGFQAARGDAILVLDQDDWITPGLVEAMALMREHRADLVCLPCNQRRASAQVWSGPESFRTGAAELVESGELLDPHGKIVRSRLISGQGLHLGSPSFMMGYIEGVSVAACAAGPCYRTVPTARDGRGAFNPELFADCEREHERLLALYRRWGLERDNASLVALHRRYYRQIIACVRNASLGTGRLSSIERRERVQDMLDSASTRATVELLKPAAKELGHELATLFPLIARRDAAACGLRVRLQDMGRRMRMPLVWAASLARR